MTPELLFLLAIFILLPLLEKLLQSVRRRAESQRQGLPAPPAPPPPRRAPEPDPLWEPAPPPRAPRTSAPAAAPPALRRLAEADAESRRARARALLAAREAARDTARDAARDAARRPLQARRGRHPLIDVLHRPGGLHRAILLRNILGPCRGVERPGSDWER
jgi:hypothetical protein